MTQSQNDNARPLAVECVNGHSCHQGQMTCRACGGAITDKPTGAATTAAFALSSRDATELAARRAASAALLEKYKGFKPLMLWYSAWAILFVAGAFSAFSTKGGVGPGFICLGLAALSALYARYLFRGGLRRVWFFIF